MKEGAIRDVDRLDVKIRIINRKIDAVHSVVASLSAAISEIADRLSKLEKENDEN